MFPLGLTCGKYSFSPSTTLGDLLKQSGIKECKSKKNKKPDDNKKKQKYYYEKYLKNEYQSTINKVQELKNPPKNLLSPIEKESSNEEFEIAEDLPKKTVKSKKNDSKEEILESLNFIDDCQKYKKRTFGDEKKFLNSSRYVDKYQNSKLRKEFQTSECPMAKSNFEDDIQLLKEKENDEIFIEDFQPKETGSFLEWTFKDEADSILESPVLGEPSAKLSSGDISKIDKSYLESLKSITKKTQLKIIPFLDTDELKNDGGAQSEEHVLKKKKQPHQKTPRKTDKKSLEENPENAKEAPTNIIEDLPTVYRNLTKSDQQVKKSITDTNSPASQREKPATHSKTAIQNIRKKRTFRKKCLKNEADAFIETSIPGEDVNTGMVQELWTRTPKKASEYSLTSASSAYASEIDDFRILDSYKCLSKFVQEEITNIVNKSGEKCKRKTEKSKSSAEALEKSNDTRRKLHNSLQGNSSEVQILKSEVKPPLYKKKQPNPQLPAFFAKDIPKEVNCSILDKKAKKEEKLPSKAIENWSIMNRLEQAFLALGTPSFEDKKKSATPPKTPKSVRSGLQKSQTENNANKKPPRTTNVSVKKDIKGLLSPDSSLTKKNLPIPRTSHSPLKQKMQNEKTNALHEKYGRNEEKKNPNPQQLQVKYLKMSKNNENNIKFKKKKKTSKEKNQNLLNEKTNKKDGATNVMKLSGVPVIPAAAESSEISLERKSTFSIITLPSSKNIIQQPRKSKGCNKSDGNITICYLKTNNKENQLPTEQNLIGPPKLSKSNGNEEGIKKTSTITHKRLTKTSLNMEPSPERETPKNSEEKEYTSLKKNPEKPKVAQPKKTERAEEILPNTSEKKKEYNETPAQDLPVLKINSSGTNNGKVRAVKKRSILSVPANQSCNEPSALEQIQEKDTMDICVFSPNALEKEYMRDFNTSQITVIITHSNTSVTSTMTYVNECNRNNSSHTRTPTTVVKLQESSVSDTPEWCSDTIFPSVTECRTEPSEPTLRKHTPEKKSWEKDLSNYHQIVKEIISQYNRIDGLLKQSEKVDTLTSEGLGSNTESKLLSLREYRKRIISEYKALPNYEYKSKILENSYGNLSLAEAKRNLAVVKDIETYEDEDVKDCSPKMKKILDSQLYVEPENLTQRVEHKEKLLSKNSSLQDIQLSKNEGLCNVMNKRLKSFSTKIFPPQYSHAKLCSSQEAPSKDSCLEHLSSFSGADFFKQSETETETS